MTCLKLRTIFLFLFVISNLLHAFAIDDKKRCFLTPKVTVNIANKLSHNTQLLLHCASRNDDLGIQTIGVNNGFTWTFCTDSVWHSTVYHCNFKAGQKQQNIIAYEEARREHCKDNVCYWTARDDGIYFFEFKYFNWE
ncbi:hypothetical protein PHJA_001326400 [Phtheirospermum japonicum]|uniref:S-protein homolog n=1 Tax=Phtheirospermum japonicum TaxID=374723 RepID=A0A830C6C0_9LAMI|nr:hypothetical protein PHJA_001326400 [Phtheirospermum japonicum]